MHEESEACNEGHCLDIVHKTCPAAAKDASCACDNGYKAVGGGCISRHSNALAVGSSVFGFSRPSLDGSSWECGGGPGTAEITVTCANINTVVKDHGYDQSGESTVGCAAGNLIGGGCSVFQNQSPFSTSTVTGAGSLWHCKSSLPNRLSTGFPIETRTICAANQLPVYQAAFGGVDYHNGEVRARPCGTNQQVLGGGCEVHDGMLTAGFNFFNQSPNTEFGANASPSYDCGGFGTHKTTIGICMDTTLNFGDFI
jgi:hypothetical protein